MINIDVSGLSELNSSLVAQSEGLNESVHQAMLRIAIEMQRYIVMEKLQGQVLHHRTGHLQRSTTQVVEENSVNSWTAIVGTGQEAWYGKIHEYGGTFTVREHLARSVKGDRHLVAAHSITFPVRSYLRSALADRLEDIKRQLAEAAVGAIE
jgi:phage gpG-like protein